MKKFVFKTTTTMKGYNNKKWWIDSNIIRDVTIEAENLKEAIDKWKEIVSDKFCIEISGNAIKNKNPMFVDTPNGTKQVGYVITASADFEDTNNYKFVKQYVDLWVTIMQLSDIEF